MALKRKVIIIAIKIINFKTNFKTYLKINFKIITQLKFETLLEYLIIHIKY
jgi:hypothetical protein